MTQATLDKPKKRTPTAAAKRAPVSRPRKRLDEDGLKGQEGVLRKKYRHIVKGTLRNASKNKEDRHYNKRTVEITCTKRGCKATRRIATSDLAQVSMCEEHTRLARLKRRRDARKAK
jgi:hypothetical protein